MNPAAKLRTLKFNFTHLCLKIYFFNCTCETFHYHNHSKDIEYPNTEHHFPCLLEAPAADWITCYSCLLVGPATGQPCLSQGTIYTTNLCSSFINVECCLQIKADKELPCRQCLPLHACTSLPSTFASSGCVSFIQNEGDTSHRLLYHQI